MLKIKKDIKWVTSYEDITEDIVRCLTMYDELPEAISSFDETELSELSKCIEEFYTATKQNATKFHILNTGLSTHRIIQVCNSNVIQISPDNYQRIYGYCNTKLNAANCSIAIKHDKNNMKLYKNVLVATSDNEVLGIILLHYYHHIQTIFPSMLNVMIYFYGKGKFSLDELDKWVKLC